MSTAPDPRTIPSVHVLVERFMAGDERARVGRGLVVDAARSVIDEYRATLMNGGGPAAQLSAEDLVQRVTRRLADEERTSLPAAINATGIVIHTGLGRALAAAAVEAIVRAAGPTPVELDLARGERGRRADHVRARLVSLTGAESASVVNNNAAALVLALAALARGREVVVSRGELIEIGGSFRLPDIMAASGAILREVGTTNRTRLADYADAIGPSTAALLKVHPANYRIEGFHEDVAVEAVGALGRERGVHVIHDVGSGALRPLAALGVSSREPDVARSVTAGADLVLFSGDKLLGGPQAGILVGRAHAIDMVERHPLMRAMRTDKLTLAALAATLELHRDADTVMTALPVFAMLAAPLAALETRARRIVAGVADHGSVGSIGVERSVSHLGGGAVPAEAIPSRAVALRSRSIGEDELARRLRTGRPPVVPRTHAGRVWLDVRTFPPERDVDVIRALRAALSEGGDGER